MSTTLCRVSIYTAGGGAVDVSLPTGVPVGTLLPSLCDIALRGELVDSTTPRTWALSPPGLPALDASKTLSENNIRDGSPLLLGTDDGAPPPRIRHHDNGAALVAAGETPLRWTADWSRVTAALTAVAMAAVAGFLFVPGPSAVPRLLFAFAAAATVSTVAALLGNCGTTALTIVALVCALTASAALVATVLDLPLAETGIGLAVTSMVLLAVAGRLALVVSGLSPRLQMEHGADPHSLSRERLAHRLLARLEGAAGIGIGLGVLPAVSACTGWPVCGFFAAVATAVLLRSRAHLQPGTRALLVAIGIGCATAVLVSLERTAAVASGWLCGAAVGLGGLAVALGFGTLPQAAPVLRRCADAAEVLAPALTLPMAAWVLGVFDAARGIGA